MDVMCHCILFLRQVVRHVVIQRVDSITITTWFLVVDLSMFCYVFNKLHVVSCQVWCIMIMVPIVIGKFVLLNMKTLYCDSLETFNT